MYLRALLLTLLLTPFVPNAAFAARLYLDPSEGSYGPGDSFMLNVRIDNENECINAAQVEVRYPKESIKAVDFSRGSSIFTLWAEEPKIDTERGVVTFAGGTPGGYCGRIPGDPVISNVLGKIVFTVIAQAGASAEITPSNTSSVYLNDGLGTKAPVVVSGATIQLLDTATGAANPWLQEVDADTIAPDPFRVEVQSTRGVFGGSYYIVFSTVDKQSGISHYELYERGAWKTVTSPYQLRDQSPETIMLRAVDKAGNERVAEFDASAIPERQTTLQDQALLLLGLIPLILAAFIVWHRERRRRREEAAAVPPMANPGA